MTKKLTPQLNEIHLIEAGMRRGEEIARSHEHVHHSVQSPYV